MFIMIQILSPRPLKTNVWGAWGQLVEISPHEIEEKKKISCMMKF